MAIRLNRQYLEEHRQSVHTLESFGAAIADMAFQMALDRIGDGDTDVIEFDMPVRIEARTLRRSFSQGGASFSEAKAELPEGTTELTIGPVTIDCITVTVGLGIGIHFAI